MGTYTELYIADFPVLSSKNEVLLEAMCIFRESDKKCFKRKFSARNPMTWGHAFAEHGNDEEIAYEYSNAVANIRLRLDIAGFTLKKTQEVFEKIVRNEIKEIKSSRHSRKTFIDEVDLLKKTKFQDLLDAFKYIYDRKILTLLDVEEACHEIPCLTQYILRASDNWGIAYSFKWHDIRYFIRSFIEICPNDATIKQDVTDLVVAGYYHAEEPICESYLDGIIKENQINGKIIILTEGSTDAEILRKSLELLYPHIAEYYSFIDFHCSKTAGGAPALVNIVKSFIGSGINNRIIAIFDNDTASAEATSALDKIKIPENIKLLFYPKLSLAKKYPTRGPTGIKKMNVNKLACSIEMYFGVDVLAKPNSKELYPIQWKGYNEKLKRYQGEIEHKIELQKKFIKKLDQCIEKPELVKTFDWSSIKLIFEMIFGVWS